MFQAIGNGVVSLGSGKGEDLSLCVVPNIRCHGAVHHRHQQLFRKEVGAVENFVGRRLCPQLFGFQQFHRVRVFFVRYRTSSGTTAARVHDIVGTVGKIRSGHGLDRFHAVDSFLRRQTVAVHVVSGNDSAQEDCVLAIVSLVKDVPGAIDQQLGNDSFREYVAEIMVSIVGTEEDDPSISPSRDSKVRSSALIFLHGCDCFGPF
mmetsp:Transcript_890/g.1908  ORF Transcript_890/g.1908 Transcript_890/m.1908 type:complete len:205 (+) Transcript_890:944-1558(+)